MIYSGSAPIGNMKYGSQQIAKIYQGSNLIWENDQWMELHIGDDFIVKTLVGASSRASRASSVDTVGSSNSDKFTLGANLQAELSSGNNSNSPITNAFNGDEDDYGYVSVATSSAPQIYVYLTFPFDVYVQSVSIIDCASQPKTRTFKAGSIRGYVSKSDNDPDTLVTISDRSKQNNVKLVSDYDIPDQYRDNPYKKIMLYASKTGWGADGSGRDISELKMTVRVRKSDYYAWKQRNSSLFPSDAVVV